MPWEYEEDALITLCKNCHSKEHEIKDGVVTKQVPTIDRLKSKQDNVVIEQSVLSIIDFCKLKDLFIPDNQTLFLIFLKLCEMVEYSTNRTKIGVNGFKAIRKSVPCKEKKVKETITLLKKLGYLKNKDGYWYVNPLVCWKGDLSGRNEAIQKFKNMH